MAILGKTNTPTKINMVGFAALGAFGGNKAGETGYDAPATRPAILTVAQVTVAHALAAAHSHTWGGLELAAVLALPELTPDAIHALSVATFVEPGPCGWGESAPFLGGPEVYHCTGTGRLEWFIAPDGETRIFARRPYVGEARERYLAEVSDPANPYPLTPEEAEEILARGFTVFSAHIQPDGTVNQCPWSVAELADCRQRHYDVVASAAATAMAALTGTLDRAWVAADAFALAHLAQRDEVARLEAEDTLKLYHEAAGLIKQVARAAGGDFCLAKLAAKCVEAAAGRNYTHYDAASSIVRDRLS